MLRILAVSLALTLVLEEGFALAWGLRGRRELGLAALVNCLTNPPVVLLYHTATALWGWSAPTQGASGARAAAGPPYFRRTGCWRTCPPPGISALPWGRSPGRPEPCWHAWGWTSRTPSPSGPGPGA